MKCILTAISLLLLCLNATAQDQVKITDPTRIVLQPDLHKSKAAIAGMQAAGMTSEQEDLVMNYSDPQYWPVGLRTDSARQANAAYFQNYTGFLVCSYVDDSTHMTVMMIPAKDNTHMAQDMRPIADLYLVVPSDATEPVLPAAPRPAISKGPRWKNLPEAKIIQTGDLYATPDLGNDSVALEAFARYGMNQAEIDAVVFRSHERNWPEAIDQFEERQNVLPQFNKYKAYLGAKWGDKVLLIVPVEKNKKMPRLMRPYVDIYFVYNASAIQSKKARKR